jgi:hypothetical protein
MKGYLALTKTDCFEIKEIDLCTWKENNKTCYGVNFGYDLIEQLPIDCFNYLKKLDCNNFNKVIKYIAKKVKISSFTLLEYDKDDLWFYNGNLELSRKRIKNDIVVDITDKEYWELANRYLTDFSLLNGVEVILLGKNKKHCCISDNAINRYKYAKLKQEFGLLQERFVEDLNSRL